MKISTKGRYGLRVMLELSQSYGQGPVRLSAIAKDQDISKKYLHSVLATLKTAGLVLSVRGAGGGYLLAKHPMQINVGEIVRALEGPFNPVECVGNPTACKQIETCVANEVWRDLGKAMSDVLEQITLEDLLTRQRNQQKKRLMYYI